MLPRRTARRWQLIVGSVVVVLIAVWRFWPRPQPVAPGERQPELLWEFEQPEAGAILSSPRLDGGRVFIGAILDSGFAPKGIVYALDADTGKIVWKFDGAGQMIHMFSSPTVADGRVFIGEGMHANAQCMLYAIDAVAGRELWHFDIKSHIESSPVVVDGVVYFGGGDEGVFAVDAATGKQKWNFNDSLHVDSTLAVVNGRVYGGSGDSRRYKTTQVFCLDAATGAVIWRQPAEQPVWGAPLVVDDQLFIGLANGRLVNRAAQPAGGLLCLDAGTGRERWRHDAGDTVVDRPAVDAGRVYFGAGDGSVYALERNNARVVWKTALGSEVVAAPSLTDGRLYVVAAAGRVGCLDPADGRLLSQYNVAEKSKCKTRLFSAPLVIPDTTTGRHRVYFGAELLTPTGSQALLYCLRW